MTGLHTVTGLVLAYLLGCASAGYYLVLWRAGRDVRLAGSGATGALNVGRQLGRTGFAATLLLDALKGALAVAMARHAGWEEGACLAILAAVIAGHLWPVQLSFRGGKGVAPFLGGLLAHDPRLLLLLGLAAGILWLPLRRLSAAGLAAMAALPVVTWRMGASVGAVSGLALCVVGILFAHRWNVRELISGRPTAGGSRTTPRGMERP